MPFGDNLINSGMEQCHRLLCFIFTIDVSINDRFVIEISRDPLEGASEHLNSCICLPRFQQTSYCFIHVVIIIITQMI